MHLFPAKGTCDSTWYFAKLSLPVQNALNFTAVVKGSDAEYNYITNDDNLVYMRTNRNAAKFRLVRIDLNNPDESNWHNIIGEDPQKVLNNAVAVNNHSLAVIYMKNVVQSIEIHNLVNGKYLWNVDIPIGTVDSISAQRTETDLFYKITTFLEPGIIYHYDFSTNRTKVSSSNEQAHI